MTERWNKARQEVLAAARQMLEKGLVTGTAGNVSQRLSGSEKQPMLAITPTSRDYLTLVSDDIVIVDFNGKRVEGELAASIETPLHIGIYNARQDVNAIIHTHSVFATSAAVAGQEIPSIMDEQVAYLGGTIKVTVHAPSGSAELVKNAVAALGDRNAVLLANHGAIGVGKNMKEAFRAAELVEKTAQIFLLALSTGRVNILTQEAQAAARLIYDEAHRTDV